MTKLYSYVVVHDLGFAPNPFWGTCTLATCKPLIRSRAQVGDWIVGTGSKSVGRHEHLVFVMLVTEAMTYSEYWRNDHFSAKKPMTPIRAGRKKACGDNIYHKLGPGRWRQRTSFHNENDIAGDTSADRVLASNDFAYWGGEGPKVPDRFLQAGFLASRGYKSNFSLEMIEDFVAWFRGLGARGRLAYPTTWPDDAEDVESCAACDSEPTPELAPTPDC